MGNLTSKFRGLRRKSRSQLVVDTIQRRPFGENDRLDDDIDNLIFEEEGERYEISGELLKQYFVAIVKFGNLSQQQWNDLLKLLPNVQKYTQRQCCFCFAFDNKLGEHHIRGDPDFQICKLCIRRLKSDITISNDSETQVEMRCLYYRCQNVSKQSTFPFCNTHQACC